MSTSAAYIRNGDTTGNINAGAEQGWIPLLQGGGTIGFQVSLAATGAPIGTFIFETTDDEQPLSVNGHILGAVAITLAAPYNGATYQPTDGAARAVNFDFGPSQPNPSPSARWIRMRYARSSGGSAAAGSLNVGISQRGGV